MYTKGDRKFLNNMLKVFKDCMCGNVLPDSPCVYPMHASCPWRLEDGIG